MGVIQQSFNQAFSMAGLAKHLYQQSPGYQKKLEDEEFKESKRQFIEGQEVLGRQRKLTKEGSPEREAIDKATLKLGEQRSNELLSRGRYAVWARQEKVNANNKKRKFRPDVELDEQKAKEANDRAEDIARQVSEQNQRNRDILRQLRGLLPLSQELVAKHKEGIK